MPHLKSNFLSLHLIDIKKMTPDFDSICMKYV